MLQAFDRVQDEKQGQRHIAKFTQEDVLKTFEDIYDNLCTEKDLDYCKAYRMAKKVAENYIGGKGPD